MSDPRTTTDSEKPALEIRIKYDFPAASVAGGGIAYSTAPGQSTQARAIVSPESPKSAEKAED